MPAVRTPWPADTPPSSAEIDAAFSAEGLSPSHWSNGPGERYGAHSHPYHKVLYCVSGRITFVLIDDNDSVELHPAIASTSRRVPCTPPLSGQRASVAQKRPEAEVRLDDPDAPEQIADLLGASIKQAEFSVPDEERGPQPVYELSMPSSEHGEPLTIILWPSLARVDVRLAQSTWTLKGIDDAGLYPGVEVLFRRHDPVAILFVSTNGRVALVT